MVNKYKKTINISLDKKMIEALDEVCKEAEEKLHKKITRSGVIETALVFYFKMCQKYEEAKRQKPEDKNIQ